MSITRRLFIHTAAAGAAVIAANHADAVVSAVAEPKLTPDERINRAIDEIKAAFWEKWPEAPLRIADYDNIDNGMVLIVSHVGGDKPGEVRHNRDGAARAVQGGAA